jgi:hypothetical protein
MSKFEVKAVLLEIAKECFQRGQSYSMTRIVMDQFIVRRPEMKDSLEREHLVLECWQQLFSEGTLIPGWNLNNPDYPFFHVAQR